MSRCLLQLSASPSFERSHKCSAVCCGLFWPADHSSDHSCRYRCSNNRRAERPEMFSRVAELVFVVRVQKITGAHGIDTISAFVKKLGLRREEHLPTLSFEPLTKIYIFVPGGIKLLVEVPDLVVCVAPY